MPYRVSIKTIQPKRYLSFLGGLLLLSSCDCVEAQVTETEAKYQKTLKDFSPIEVLPSFGLGNGKWCAWISNDPGTLFNNSSKPIFQSAVIYGNPHWQYSHVNGTDVFGNDFSGDTSELRRFKLGSRLHLLQYFTARISADMLEDSKDKFGDGYTVSDYALSTTDLIFDAQDAFNWERYDQFQLRVGYFKVPSNAGRAASSNSMRAIERSSLTEYSSPADSVGMLISAKRDSWDYDFGIFFNDDIQDGFSNARGCFWLAHIGYVLSERERLDYIRADLRLIINNDGSEGETFNQDYVISASATMRKKHWRLMVDLIYGDNGTHFDSSFSGIYWGINLMPSVWIVEDKLEAIFRAQYASAEARNGYRISSHSARRIANEEGAYINNGYGDRHKSAYAGLNYYICGDHTKVMAGVQWDHLESNNRQVYEGLTTWFSVRLYF